MGVIMIKIAAIQMEIGSNKERNLEKAKFWLECAADAGCRLACLPEYCLADCPEAGMSKAKIEAQAETIPGPTSKILGKIAKKKGMYICTGSYLEKRPDGLLQNSSALIGPDGKVIGTFQKMHPENANPKYEVSAGIRPGDDYPVFDTEIGKIGIILDMDATTAEAARIEYVKGAEIILWPLNWSARWFNQIETLPGGHAIMNKVWFVTSNRVGLRKSRHGDFLYNGGSKINNPEGFIVSRANDFHEGLAVADCDMDMLREWRKTIIPRDYPLRRRPETYGALVEPWKV
jgi:beta-ureidopropionase